MILFELVAQAGLQPIREASTDGGEYGASCPICAGTDRFRFWPDGSGRYWCRRCDAKGDAIDFCRKFLGMSFGEAKARCDDYSDKRYEPTKNAKTSPIRVPSKSWTDKADEWVTSNYKRLLIDPEVLSFVKHKYGLTTVTVSRFQIGWNPEKRFHRRSEWGIEETENKMWICLPKGIVIPFFLGNGSISKIKIRQADWTERDHFGKYFEVPGGSNCTAIYGFLVNQYAVVVESELDAICLCQEIGEFCTCIATGGVAKRPDENTVSWLRGRRLVLYSQDFDDAGCANFDYWRETFPNLRAWPSESGKSPADSYTLDGVSLSEWFLKGIRYWEERL